MAAVDLPARWWTRETVAVVTGGNTGIGLAIVRKLAQEAGLTVVLAARDEGRGLMATQHLHKDGLLNVVFRKLDISKLQSITDFAAWIKQTFGGLDILVNNAAVLHVDNAYEHAVECIDTNYHGTKNCTETLLPLLKASPAGARIVNLSSRLAWIDMAKEQRGSRERLAEDRVCCWLGLPPWSGIFNHHHRLFLSKATVVTQLHQRLLHRSFSVSVLLISVCLSLSPLLHHPLKPLHRFSLASPSPPVPPLSLFFLFFLRAPSVTA